MQTSRTMTPSLQYLLKLYECGAVQFAGDPNAFDFGEFSSGDFVGAVQQRIVAENLTRVLYPDDSTEAGRDLRFGQEYFLVACSLADIVARFRRRGNDWDALPEKVAIQLNDTHPAMAVAELMRILLDQAGLGWDVAWDLTRRTLAYTNHTLLPEALEKWPVALFEMVLPRHLEIIYEINRRFLDAEPGIFAPIWDVLLTHGDYYMHLADLSAYVQSQEQVGALYTQPDAWAHKAILNVGHSGRFSSDYTIAAYAADIWQAKPCPVE
jgi:glucan phosphorylase